MTMLRQKKNETSASFTARLAAARKCAFPESHVGFTREHLDADDPVRAVQTIIRGLVMSLEGDLSEDSYSTHRLVAAELVKLAIDHRAYVKGVKPTPAPDPAE